MQIVVAVNHVYDPAVTDQLSSAKPGAVVAPSTTVGILFLGANPLDQTRLALTREVEQIGERLRASDHADAFAITQHWAIEPSRLPGLLLRHRPTIVHFSGHGTRDGRLVFQTAGGASAPLAIKAVGNLFAILRRNIRCVVLSGCYSRTQADAIAKNIDVVIGMSDAIPDSDAIAFGGCFYEALGYGEDVKTAFDLACNAIALAQEFDGAQRDVDFGDAAVNKTSAPRLLVRDGVSVSELRFVSPCPARRRRAPVQRARAARVSSPSVRSR